MSWSSANRGSASDLPVAMFCGSICSVTDGVRGFARVLDGSRIVRVAPPPGVSLSRTVPSCEATMAETMANPNPLPPVSRFRDESAR